MRPRNIKIIAKGPPGKIFRKVWEPLGYNKRRLNCKMRPRETSFDIRLKYKLFVETNIRDIKEDIKEKKCS
ncbi:unnamed protein product [Clavelina lepadiformis]|uniref:Uncharacterized protein n=1 Tax=Clavelina lepadiformis TaxID=159417 RepID=A0ABP0FDC5_CLALP